MLKKKKVMILQKMDEVRTKKIEIEVNQDKIDYIIMLQGRWKYEL